MQIVVRIKIIFFQQPESKKEEFRRYLEGAGVMDALTKGQLQEDPLMLQFQRERESLNMLMHWILGFIFS